MKKLRRENQGPGRAERLARILYQEIESLILLELTDPALQDIVLVRIRLSSDLKQATVYYGIDTDDTQQIKDAEFAFERAKGFMRGRLSESLILKYTPALKFIHDRNYIRTRRAAEIIEKGTLEERPINEL